MNDLATSSDLILCRTAVQSNSGEVMQNSNCTSRFVDFKSDQFIIFFIENHENNSKTTNIGVINNEGNFSFKYLCI